ncbi:MAG TPA: Flp pilus assembly protein CpaB, partial [Chloroflexota bacterium]
MNAIQKSSRRGPRILLAFLLAAAAAGGVYLYVSNIQATAQVNVANAQQQQQLAAAAASRARVVTAKQTLAAQTQLTNDNVELRDTLQDAIQPNAATSLTDVVGKTLLVPVATGQQILAPFLTNTDQPDVKKLSDLVPAGKRAMSVNFTEQNSAGGLVQPGDSVDVIGVFNKNTLGKDQSMLLMQDILVL